MWSGRANVMPEAYVSAALYARKLRHNRPTLLLSAMSNKFALSDTKSYAGKQFNFTAGFVGWPVLMRFKHFPEKRTGVHEIPYRYL